METATAVAALAALAQDSRLLAFRALVQAGPGGLAAGTIGERLRIPPATLSFHLSQLARAGLVRSQRSGRSVVYSADYETMGRLLEYLTENCCRLPDRADRRDEPAVREARGAASKNRRSADGDEERGKRGRRRNGGRGRRRP